MRNFTDPTERDLLALAISSEEEDSRVYADFALLSVGELLVLHTAVQ